jgi:hypothetical protein
MLRKTFDLPFGFHDEVEVLALVPKILPIFDAMRALAVLRRENLSERKILFKGDYADQNIYAYSKAFLKKAEEKFTDMAYEIINHAPKEHFFSLHALSRRFHSTPKTIKNVMENYLGLENILITSKGKRSFYLIHKNVVPHLEKLLIPDESLYTVHTGEEPYYHAKGWIRPRPSLTDLDIKDSQHYFQQLWAN